LHTWGQGMNQHVHVHVILTGGGLSLDGKRWVAVDHHSPLLSRESLAAEFKKMFLCRLKHLLKRLPSSDVGPDVGCVEQVAQECCVASASHPACQVPSGLNVSQLAEHTTPAPTPHNLHQVANEAVGCVEQVAQECCVASAFQAACQVPSDLNVSQLAEHTTPESTPHNQSATQLLARLKQKTWMVNNQSPPPIRCHPSIAPIRYHPSIGNT